MTEFSLIAFFFPLVCAFLQRSACLAKTANLGSRIQRRAGSSSLGIAALQDPPSPGLALVVGWGLGGSGLCGCLTASAWGSVGGEDGAGRVQPQDSCSPPTIKILGLRRLPHRGLSSVRDSGWRGTAMTWGGLCPGTSLPPWPVALGLSFPAPGAQGMENSKPASLGKSPQPGAWQHRGGCAHALCVWLCSCPSPPAAKGPWRCRVCRSGCPYRGSQGASLQGGPGSIISAVKN